MKKLLIFVLLSIVLTLSACSNTESNSENTANGSLKNEDKTVTLPIFSYQSPRISSYGDDNDLTKFIKERFNVDIEWTLVTDEARLEKQNVLFASGNYPSLFFGGVFTQNDQIKYGQSGILIPLNDLIDQYAPNIKEAFENSPSLLNMVTSPDGNIYALAGQSECYHCNYSQKMWINTEWLSKLGLPMPTTTDELYHTLKAFKEEDPNGNGKKDEIPLTGAINWWHGEPTHYLMNSFIYADDLDFLTLSDGKVDISANKPEWREGIVFIKKLFAEGLIDPQAYTQNFDGLSKVADNPETVIMGAYTGGCCVPSVKEDSGRWTQYEVLPPVKGPNGVQLTGYFGGNVESPDAQFAITNKATKEQQIKAIQIVDYFFSNEGGLTSTYGPKGIGWVVPEEGALGINGEPAIFEDIITNTENTSASWDINLHYFPTKLFNGWAQDPDVTKVAGFERFLAEQTDKLVAFKPKETFPQAIWFNPDESQKLAQIKVDILNYININTLQFIVGNKDLDKEWDAYVKGFDGLGLAEFIKANQEAYDQQYK